jgi:hypothetical protein
MDKKIPAFIVAFTLSSELVPHHEAPPPHIELEIKPLMPSSSGSISSSGGAARNEPLGTFRGNLLYSKMRRYGLRKKGEARTVAMLDAYFDTAKAIMENYPNLKKWERVMQYNIFKYSINRYIALTHGYLNCSNALPAIAQVLCVPETYFTEQM